MSLWVRNVRKKCKKYGPIAVPTQECIFGKHDQWTIKLASDLWPVIRFRQKWSIWVGSRCTRQCRHVLAKGRRLSRPLDEVRLLDEVYVPSARRGPSSRRGIYFIRSARSNLSRTFFSRKMKCRITGRPRYPDHQQPSHKRGRTTARSATGTSVAPGPPVTHVAPLPHPIDPEVRRACMKVRGGYRTEARRPPYPPPGPMPLPTYVHGAPGVHMQGDPEATEVPVPGEQVSVCTCPTAVYCVEIVGSIRRRFFSTSSS
jgi:hypothetical protein